MSTEAPFTKDNMNSYLSALAKEFRKLNGTAMPAEIVLVGGASILANYGFRDTTYDIDAVISASSVMKEAINRVGDKKGLPNGWLNMDFKTTRSYSNKLFEVAVYYRTFSNILTVRTIAAEYLIAMKLMSGRQYKNDFSDIAGILWEHQKRGSPISRKAIDKAINTLYGGPAEIPKSSLEFINDVFNSDDYGNLIMKIRANELDVKKTLIEIEGKSPNALSEDNINTIIEQAKHKREQDKLSD